MLPLIDIFRLIVVSEELASVAEDEEVVMILQDHFFSEDAGIRGAPLRHIFKNNLF